MSKGHLDGPPDGGITFSRNPALGGSLSMLPPKDGGKYVMRHHPSDQSMKRCRIHGIRQKIETLVIGPIPIFHCNSILPRAPRNSHWKVWTVLLPYYGKRFIAPIEGEWFVVIVRATCSFCKTHDVKMYRRLFGMLSRSINERRARTSPESYRIVPFDPTRPLEEQIQF